MKNLDLRSLMIGFLGCLCMFLFMGQTSGTKYFDRIVVGELDVAGSILVGTEESKYIQIFNEGIVAINGLHKMEFHAEAVTGWYDERMRQQLGSATSGGLFVLNEYNERTVYIGNSTSGEGLVKVADNRGNFKNELIGRN